MGRKLGITVTLAVLAMLAAPVAATAATARYTAPTSQGSDDCTSPANACPLESALSAAVSGDTIYLLGNHGDYNLGTGSVDPGSKVLHFVGINGTPRLITNTSSTLLTLSAAPSSATGLYLENDGSGDGLVVQPTTGSGGFRIDRVFVKTASPTTIQTCLFNGDLTLTNSVCWQASTSGTGSAIQTEFTNNTIRNVVAWQSGSGTAIQCGAYYGRCMVTILNTIARATGSGGSDLGTFSSGSYDATITARYSNFGSAVKQGSYTSKDHFTRDATDQSATPALVNPGVGNFHEQTTSPTINAGVTNSANGALDLGGRPRTVGGKTDIGAYELGTPLPKRPHATRITKAKINRHKHTATFKFTAKGTVNGFQCALIKQRTGRRKKSKPHFGSCRSPKTYRHLKNARYIFKVRAVNSAGPDRIPAIKKFTL